MLDMFKTMIDASEYMTKTSDHNVENEVMKKLSYFDIIPIIKCTLWKKQIRLIKQECGLKVN